MGKRGVNAGCGVLALVAAAGVGCGASTRAQGDAHGGSAGAAVERGGEGGLAGSGGLGGLGGLAGVAGQPEDPAALIGAWNDRVNRAACEREVRCGRLSSVERCLDWRGEPAMYATHSIDATYVSYFGGVDVLSYLASEYRVADEATLDACLDEIGTGTCDDSAFRPVVCEGSLVPRAPHADGEPCAAPSPYLEDRPCAAGLGCVCGVCTAVATEPLAEGEVCAVAADCEPGFTCLSLGSDTSHCAPTPTLGEACDFQCVEGACSYGLCRQIVGLGAACGDGTVCQTDLDCEGTCVERLGVNGAPCARESGLCLGFCTFAAATGSTGVCGIPSSAAPTPCSQYDGGEGPFCPAGTYQQDTPDSETECFCLPHLALGAPCTAESTFDAWQAPCGDGFCSNGICTARYPAGTACVDGSECASNLLCDEASHTCLALACAY